MVQLIKKGGLRERANRSRHYHGSENTEAALAPNRYQQRHATDSTKVKSNSQPVCKTDESSANLK